MTKTTTKTNSGSTAVRYNYAFAKAEEHPDYTFVLGPVLVPEEIDKQGDIISSEEIEKAAHDYIQDSRRPGLMHQLMLGTLDAQVVESYVTRGEYHIGKQTIKEGTWLVGMRVFNKRLREMIRSGKLKGYSIGGVGVSEEERGST
jgi:hypothetical protein